MEQTGDAEGEGFYIVVTMRGMSEGRPRRGDVRMG